MLNLMGLTGEIMHNNDCDNNGLCDGLRTPGTDAQWRRQSGLSARSMGTSARSNINQSTGLPQYPLLGLVMAALRSSCGHCILQLWLLSSSFFLSYSQDVALMRI